MPGMFYFFEALGGSRLIAEAGLRERWARDPASVEVGPDYGPDGRAGTIFHAYAGPLPPKPIRWTAAPAGNYWVGYHEPNPPGPGDFWRGETIAGFDITLADGHDWRIPLILPAEGRPCGLPDEPDAAGNWAPKRIYDQLRFNAFRWLAYMQEAEGEPPGLAEYCADCLAVGYRVALPELAALGALDRRVCSLIALASVDFVARLEQARDPAAGEHAAAAEALGQLQGAAHG